MKSNPILLAFSALSVAISAQAADKEKPAATFFENVSANTDGTVKKCGVATEKLDGNVVLVRFGGAMDPILVEIGDNQKAYLAPGLIVVDDKAIVVTAQGPELRKSSDIPAYQQVLTAAAELCTHQKTSRTGVDQGEILRVVTAAHCYYALVAESFKVVVAKGMAHAENTRPSGFDKTGKQTLRLAS